MYECIIISTDIKEFSFFHFLKKREKNKTEKQKRKKKQHAYTSEFSNKLNIEKKKKTFNPSHSTKCALPRS